MMSRRALVTCTLIALIAIGYFLGGEVRFVKESSLATSTPAALDPKEWYPVVRVVDGDTIIVSIEGKGVRVRLIGLDTPESVDPRVPVECFGHEASDQMKRILTTQYVRVQEDPSQGRFDKYGRLLAYIYAPLDSTQEGLLMNEYMIREGYGHEYTYNLPYKYQATFRAAEREAREQKKGLWAADACKDF